MNRLGRNELYLGMSRTRTDNRRYDAVTAGTISELSQQHLDFDKMSFSAVGKVENADAYRGCYADGREIRLTF
jgi:hypothetical protein